MKIKGLKESFGLAGASIGMGIMGEAFESEALASGGEVAGSFVPVVVSIGMGANVIDMLKGIKRKKK